MADFQEKIEAFGVNGMWRYDLLVRWIEVAFQEVLEVLQVADLTCNSKPAAVDSTPLVKYIYGLIAMVDSLVEDEVGADGETCAPLACFAMDGDHTLHFAGKVQNGIHDEH